VLYYATINEVKQADLLAVAKEFCVNNPVKIINKVKTALSHWGNLASEYGVSNTQRLVIGQELARMRKNET
jgi:hypothetical protein